MRKTADLKILSVERGKRGLGSVPEDVAMAVISAIEPFFRERPKPVEGDEIQPSEKTVPEIVAALSAKVAELESQNRELSNRLKTLEGAKEKAVPKKRKAAEKKEVPRKEKTADAEKAA